MKRLAPADGMWYDIAMNDKSMNSGKDGGPVTADETGDFETALEILGRAAKAGLTASDLMAAYGISSIWDSCCRIYGKPDNERALKERVFSLARGRLDPAAMRGHDFAEKSEVMGRFCAREAFVRKFDMDEVSRHAYDWCAKPKSSAMPPSAKPPAGTDGDEKTEKKEKE
jgi:hypothetical protein